MAVGAVLTLFVNQDYRRQAAEHARSLGDLPAAFRTRVTSVRGSRRGSTHSGRRTGSGATSISGDPRSGTSTPGAESAPLLSGDGGGGGGGGGASSSSGAGAGDSDTRADAAATPLLGAAFGPGAGGYGVVTADPPTLPKLE